MSLSDTSKINISIKKLSGKAQTSNNKGLANEGLPSGLTLSSHTVFGEVVAASPSKSSFYTITDGSVEYLRLSASYIEGTDTASGRHAFSLQLPDDYESNSSNSKAGTYPFKNRQKIYITSGSLQLVPPSFATAYEAIPYHSSSGVHTQIPVLDARDWYLDYFNGIFFQQDPPATGDSSENPRYVDAFLYIGDFVSDVTNSGGGDPNAEYLVLSATGSLPNERVINPGLGIEGIDAGAGSSYTLRVKDSIVATLTGSQFNGNVGITGSFGVQSNVSGYYAATIDNDNGSNGHGLKVTSDGTGSGTNIFDIESASTTFFRVRGDGRVGIGKVSSLPSSVLTVSSSNSDSDIAIAHKIQHIGDADTYMLFDNDEIDFVAGGSTFIKLDEGANDTLIVNPLDLDIDFQAKGQNIANLIRTDAANDRIGIGLATPSTLIHINEISPTIRIQRKNQIETSILEFAGAANVVGSSIENEGSTNDLVFRTFGNGGASVEEILRLGGYYASDQRRVVFLSGSGVHVGAMQPAESLDISFFVSGAIGSAGTSTRGTSVFGGDVVVSGSLISNNVISRKKVNRKLTGSLPTGLDCNLEIDFSSVTYNKDRIDIFVNGQLLQSGSPGDYLLNTVNTGSIRFNFNLITSDNVIAIIN